MKKLSDKELHLLMFYGLFVLEEYMDSKMFSGESKAMARNFIGISEFFIRLELNREFKPETIFINY